MKIVVSHLTRMQPGYVCVAGINLSNRHHVRPVLGRRLTSDLLLTNGGVFGIGAIVDLGRTYSAGTAPELEDYQFSTDNLKYLGMAEAQDFWEMIDGASTTTLEAIFGESSDHLRTTVNL